MFNKTKIALSVAMVLGVLGTASAALAANEHDDSVGGREAARQVGNPLPWWWNAPSGAKAYGFAGSVGQTHRPSHDRR
jgi:hypothetical protein